MLEKIKKIFKRKPKAEKKVKQKEKPLVLFEENKPEVKSETRETKSETKSETTSSLTFGE